MSYAKQYHVRWADLDPNGHMRTSGYADYTTEVRFRFLAEHGFSAARFHALGCGPVVFTEEYRYLKEVLMGETITVTLRTASVSPYGMRWTVQQEVITSRGETAATVRVSGALLDLKSRKLATLPPDLLALFEQFPEVES